MRKELRHRLLRELLKDSKRSDRDLAKVLEVSQPTVTRTRHNLEGNGMIQDYTIVPDFRKMGFELLALTFVKMRSDILEGETRDRAEKYAAEFPNVIFASCGTGLGMTGVILSFHGSFTEYQKQLNMLRDELGDVTEDVKSFIVAIGEREFKSFSLKHLGDIPV